MVHRLRSLVDWKDVLSPDRFFPLVLIATEILVDGFQPIVLLGNA